MFAVMCKRFRAMAGLVVAMLVVVMALSVDALGQHRPLTAESLVQVRVISDTARIAPGRTFHLAVIFDIAEHWHIYWQDAGDAGAPTEIAVRAPEGFTVGEPLYPRPKAFAEMVGTTFGYEGRAVLFVPITAPQRLEQGVATFEAEVFYFVCRDSCLIGQEKRSIRLETVGNPAEAGDAGGGHGAGKSADAVLLEEHRQRLPRPIEKLKGAEARLQDGRLVITGPAGGHTKVEFFPIALRGVKFGETERIVEDDRFRVTAQLDIQPHNISRKGPSGPSIRGVVGLGGKVDDPCYYFDLPLKIDKAER